MAHIVLVGDSIFDNARYTEGGPDVIAQVSQLLPRGWQASLLAVDGSTTENIPAQVERLPSDASHLVLSVGGNDAIMNAEILNKPAQSTAQALSELNEVLKNFEANYRRAVEMCRRRGLPLAICTIYNGCFPDAEYQRLISTALMVFNDAILRVGIEYGLSIIDLRLVCALPEDYANPIEPSSIGGAKIARSIVGLVSDDGKGARVVIGSKSPRLAESARRGAPALASEIADQNPHPSRKRRG